MAGNLTAMIASIFSGSAVTADPYYEYTTLLLPGSGTNGAQNNTFLDSSTNNFTITRNGNTTQGTFSPFSQTGWGNYFDGTGDYLNLTQSVFAVGTSNFTLEGWVYLTAAPTAEAGVISSFNTGGGQGFYLGLNGSRQPTATIGSGATSNPTVTGSAISLNTWVHLAMVRLSGTIYLYVDGSSVGTPVSAGASIDRTLLGIGLSYPNSPQGFLTGYISNARVTTVAVYTGNFTPPTSPLAATQSAGTNISAITGTQTSLLTCQSNRFKDNSTNNFTITRNGDTRVVAFSPFNPTASWSAATYGGSGYFDGSGDYLTSSINAIPSGSTPFTVETWIYPTAFSGTSTIFGGVVNITEIQFSSTGISYNKAGVTGILSSSTALTLNAWNHIAVVRNGTNNSSILLNGVRLTTTASDSNTFSATTSYIGSGGATQYCFGYLSNFRFVVGTAVYDPTQTTYTVPTAPLTAITNTSLLLNFANAGIYDATSKNDLETVGNAQISNAVTPKWGSTSIKFDGTGDWLLIPDQPPQRIGTGKFTIELWVYRNSSGTYGLVGKGTGTTGWLVSLNSSNQVVFTYGSSTITSTGTVSATTWTHIAVVREGTSTNQTKIYINGTNDGTGTVSTDFNQTNSMYIGADRTGGSAANAYVQDVRITNDARYTANFTAPTAAFPTL